MQSLYFIIAELRYMIGHLLENHRFFRNIGVVASAPSHQKAAGTERDGSLE